MLEDEGTDVPAIDWLDLLFPHRDRDKSLTDSDWLAILFPPPAEADISRTVYSNGWVNRIAAGTRLGDPMQLADLLVTGLAQGKTHQEIAKDLLPHVEGVRSTARRVARTEGLRVAGAMQQQAHDQLGDLVIGYQVHSTPNPHTRPWHQQRNGTIYYLDPKPGQKGMRQCPHPPEEAEDENERPIINGRRAPQVAQNCLCYLTPVLAAPSVAVRAELALLPDAPDPGIMDEYFSRADPTRRRYMVGSKRYNAAREVLGRAPEWSDLMSPNGTLLTADELRAERPEDRKLRTATAQAQVAANREALRQTRAYGSQISQ